MFRSLRTRRLSRAEKFLFVCPLLVLALGAGVASLRRALTTHLHSIAVAPDGTVWSAYRDTSVSARTLQSGAVLRTLGNSRDANSQLFALSPDGKTVATEGASPTLLELREARTGTLLHQARTGELFAVHFSPDGTLLANNEWGSTVSFFDGRTGQKRNSLVDNGFISHVLLRDRNTAFAALNDSYTDRLDRFGVRDTRTGKWLRVWKRGGPAVGSLARSRDGRIVAFCSFSMNTKGDGATLFDARSGRVLRSLAGRGAFCRAIFSPDGTRLAAFVNRSPGARVWDVATGRELFRVRHKAALSVSGDDIVDIAWSADGKTLLTASDDSTLLGWDGLRGTPRPLAF